MTQLSRVEHLSVEFITRLSNIQQELDCTDQDSALIEHLRLSVSDILNRLYVAPSNTESMLHDFGKLYDKVKTASHGFRYAITNCKLLAESADAIAQISHSNIPDIWQNRVNQLQSYLDSQ